MKRKTLSFVIALIVGFFFMAEICFTKQDEKEPPNNSESQIQRGYYIAPVLISKGKITHW